MPELDHSPLSTCCHSLWLSAAKSWLRHVPSSGMVARGSGGVIEEVACSHGTVSILKAWVLVPLKEELVELPEKPCSNGT